MSDFQQLTEEQCAQVLAWVSERLHPLQDILDELERPEVIALLESMNALLLSQRVKDAAASAVLRIGGSQTGQSWKSDPSFEDVDLFFTVDTVTGMSLAEISQLRAVLFRRCRDEELRAQRDRCTIPGVAASIDARVRRLDFPKLGILFNGGIWPSPGRCHHCNVRFDDGRFFAMDGQIIHEGCRT